MVANKADLVAVGEIVKFQIDKTYQALFEAGKHRGEAYLSHLLMLFLLTVLVFATGPKNEVTVPFVQLTVDKYQAAILVIIISFGTLYRLQVSALHESLLLAKIHTLIHNRADVCLSQEWYLRCPTVFSSTTLLIHSQPEWGHNLLARIFAFSHLLTVFVAPFFFTWKIADRLQFGIPARIGLCIVALALLVPAYIALFAEIKIRSLSYEEALSLVEREGKRMM